MIIVWGSELAYTGAGRPLIFGGGMSGGSTVTPNTQRGNIDYDQIRGAARAGNGNKFQMLAPSGFVAGHVPEWDADGNIFDSGTTPGGGGITQLTADVTAGPGTGSQAATVVATHLTAPLPVNQGGTGTASTLTGVVRGGSPLTATELSGDVVTSGSNATTIQANAVTTSKINNAAVTYAKIQNVSANSVLLGAGASGSGAAPVEIALGTNLSMSGTTMNATGTGGSSIPIIQEGQFSTNNTTSFTFTLPKQAAASGNTLWIVLAADGGGSVTFSASGFTVDINQTQTTSSRIMVMHKVSAAETTLTVTTSGVSTSFSIYFFELGGTRTIDQSSAVGTATTNNLQPQTITPSSNSLVFAFGCFIPNGTSVSTGFIVAPALTPWNAISIGPPSTANGRSLAGLVYRNSGAGASLTPPVISITSALQGGSGVANATFSIL